MANPYGDPATWSLRTPGGIPYRIMEDHPKGSFEEDKADLTDQVLITANNLFPFVKECLSNMEVWPGHQWKYTPAMSYPGDDMQSLVVQKLEWEMFPKGLPGDPWGWVINQKLVPEHTWAPCCLVTRHYGPGKSLPDFDDDVLEMGATPTGEFLQYPVTGKTVWEAYDDTEKDETVNEVNIPACVVVPGLEWSLKYKRVPFEVKDDVLEVLRSVLGKVNSDVMPSLHNAPPETILFSGFSVSQFYSWRGEKPFFEIECKLTERRIVYLDDFVGHNHFLRPIGDWRKLKRGDGSYVYKEEAFNPVFFGPGSPNPS